jgi:predicted nucleic acid-binding protein
MKKVYLLDTNIVSEFSKENSNQNVLSIFNERRNLCAISASTWQELQFGLARMPEGKRKNYIEQCIKNYEEEFEILPYDSFAATICGNLLAKAEKDGKTLPFMDCQIAATAIANGMVLVTRNVSDFDEAVENSFLRVENWFSE